MEKQPVTTIKVPMTVRDRLAVLAESRGTTIGELVTELARTTLTEAERAERAERTRIQLAEQFGYLVTEADQVRLSAELDALFPAREGREAAA
ncbi:hypothetical protein [Streptacidiphilus albus]|uniref:hypothetical protein n=1 Tax=Streptacidiphilus albus TaxID=105425 RepID=UPI00054B86A9|nr:hypothetical protein [Streptacidiphilus albus]